MVSIYSLISQIQSKSTKDKEIYNEEGLALRRKTLRFLMQNEI